MVNWSPQKSLDDRYHAASPLPSSRPHAAGEFPRHAMYAAARIARDANEYSRSSCRSPGALVLFASCRCRTSTRASRISPTPSTAQVRRRRHYDDYGEVARYPQFSPVWENSTAARPRSTPIRRRQLLVNRVQGIAEATIRVGRDTTLTIASLSSAATSQRFHGHQFDFSATGGGALTAFAESFQIQWVSGRLQ